MIQIYVTFLLVTNLLHENGYQGKSGIRHPASGGRKKVREQGISGPGPKVFGPRQATSFYVRFLYALIEKK